MPERLGVPAEGGHVRCPRVAAHMAVVTDPRCRGSYVFDPCFNVSCGGQGHCVLSQPFFVACSCAVRARRRSVWL